MNQSGIKKVETMKAGIPHNLNSPEAVLRDLACLLEEYGPAWYTEAQHRRVQAALLSDPSRHTATAFSASH
ncbi:MAG TPA: hypothetical protein VGL22_08680 [Terracidiphilus sp.]|jgi:hypothetical protein